MHNRETGMNRLHWWTLLALLGVLVLTQTGDSFTIGKLSAAIANRFDKAASGEWWRLFTGQLIHLGWFHLAVDGASIAVVWWLVAPYFRPLRLLVTFLVAGTMGQAFALLAWRYGLTEYGSLVGSSDALHGLVYLYIAVMYRSSGNLRERLGWLVGAAVMTASTVYTCLTGRMLISSVMLSPGYNHFGGILGFILGLEIGFLKPARGEKT